MESMWPGAGCASHPRRKVRAKDGAPSPKLTLLAHEGFPYPAALRHAVLAAMNAQSTSTAELARLNWRLGLAYAEAVKETARRHHADARPDRMPRADALSPGARGSVRGPEVCMHVAGRRGAGDCRGAQACPWSRTFGPPTCSPADRARRWFRCSITCCSRMRSAGAFCRISAALPT